MALDEETTMSASKSISLSKSQVCLVPVLYSTIISAEYCISVTARLWISSEPIGTLLSNVFAACGFRKGILLALQSLQFWYFYRYIRHGAEEIHWPIKTCHFDVLYGTVTEELRTSLANDSMQDNWSRLCLQHVYFCLPCEIQVPYILKRLAFFFSRYLNSKQKALILAFAELETDVSGTVNGVDKTKAGKWDIYIFRWIRDAMDFWSFSFKRGRGRNSLNPSSLMRKKVLLWSLSTMQKVISCQVKA